jgi:hypothetical protein
MSEVFAKILSTLKAKLAACFRKFALALYP